MNLKNKKKREKKNNLQFYKILQYQSFKENKQKKESSLYSLTWEKIVLGTCAKIFCFQNQQSINKEWNSRLNKAIEINEHIRKRNSHN